MGYGSEGPPENERSNVNEKTQLKVSDEVKEEVGVPTLLVE